MMDFELHTSDPLLASSDVPSSNITEILSYWKRAGVYYALNKAQVDLGVFTGHAYVDRQWCHRSRLPIKGWSGLQHELKLEGDGPYELLFAPLCAIHTDHAADANPPLLIPFWFKIKITLEGVWEIPEPVEHWIPPIFLSTVSATYPIFGDMTAYENYLLVSDPMEGIEMSTVDSIVNTLFKELTHNELETRLSQAGYQLINEALLVNPVLISEEGKALETQLSDLQASVTPSFLNKLITFDTEFKDPPRHVVADLQQQSLVETLCYETQHSEVMSVQYTGGDGLEIWLKRACEQRWIQAAQQASPLPNLGILVSAADEAEYYVDFMNAVFPMLSPKDDESSSREWLGALMEQVNEGIGHLKAMDAFHSTMTDAYVENDGLAKEQAAISENDEALEAEFDKLSQARLFWDMELSRPSLLQRIGLKKRDRQVQLERFINDFLPLSTPWYANETLSAQIITRQRAIRVERTKMHRSLVPLAQNLVQQNSLHLKWNVWQAAHLKGSGLELSDLSIEGLEAIRHRAYEAFDRAFAPELVETARACDRSKAKSAWVVKPHALGYLVAQETSDIIDEIIVLQSEKISPLALAPFYATLQRLVVVGDDRDEHYYHMLPPTLDTTLMMSQLGELGEELDEYYGQTLSLSRGNLWELCRGEAASLGQLRSHRSMLAPLSRRASTSPTVEFVHEAWPVLAMMNIRGRSQAWAGSFRNLQEAQRIVQWFEEHASSIEQMIFQAGLQDTVLITTPYAAQAEMIRSLLKPSALSVRVEPLASCFEGASIVIYSSVHTGSDQRPFAQDEGLAVLNKVLCLSHHALWIMGDKDCFNAAEHSPSGLLAARLFKDTGQVLPGRDVETVSESVEEAVY